VTFALDDWVPAVIVAVLAAAPISVLLLLVVDVLPLPGSTALRRALKLALVVSAAPVSVMVGFAIWGAAGAAHLKPMCQAYATPVFRSTNPVPVAFVRLEVDRTRWRESRWFTFERERYRVVDTRTGAELATADELSIEAGRARHHCGVGSGPRPVSSTTHPHNDALPRFVERAARGRTVAPARASTA
jgi:hypothetical protein